MDDDAREDGELVSNLFRREAGRLVTSLTRILGVQNLELAEDVVQETLLRALEIWKYDRIPDNPAAWLARAARNRALDVIRRERTARRFAPELSALLDSEWTAAATVDEVIFRGELSDDTLRMMVACCHPELASETQAALILKILCGFSVRELAAAFLTTTAAVEKRLSRERAVLRDQPGIFSAEAADTLRERTPSMEEALYLLFNEGYHGSHPEQTIREEFCTEAIRLVALLAERPDGGAPSTWALLALLCFHAARLPARTDADGALVLLEAQDRVLWDRRLMQKGFTCLDRASVGATASRYHFEAAIAAQHCIAPSLDATDWSAILGLYDALLAYAPSPVVALNRAIVVGQLHGPDAGLRALAQIPDGARLIDYVFLPLAEGELHLQARRYEKAEACFREAARLARGASERELIERKLARCAAG